MMNRHGAIQVEHALDAEMTEHLGHAKNASVVNAVDNAHNEKSSKTLRCNFGELPIDIRRGSFKPQQLPKWFEVDCAAQRLESCIDEL